jgi:geranylgeranyl diphosphate synthase, type II
MVDVNNFLKTKAKLIDKRLDELIPLDHKYLSTFYKATRYSLLSNGKRIRPSLVLATVESFNIDSTIAIDPAVAVELIHSYSLIHDDMPCMDDDDYRRGKKSLHVAYDESTALLCGDFLLTLAFDVLANSPNIDATKKINLIKILTKYSGSKEGMIGGQYVDLSSEKQKIRIEKLKYMHINKTASLFSASIEMGAILSNVNENDFNYLCEFGEKIGLVYQLIDDIVDFSSSDVSSDIKKQKATIITLLGIEEAKKVAKNIYKSAMSDLLSLSVDCSILKSISEKIISQID